MARNRKSKAKPRPPRRQRTSQPAWQAEARSLYESERRYTLSELGVRFGVTRERVRQVAEQQGWIRHESALTQTQQKMRRIRQRKAARIWSHVEIRELRDCWYWTGNAGSNGTPRVGYVDPAIGIRRLIFARAYLYHICREPIDLNEGYLRGQGNFRVAILPNCGDSRCVNPWHCRPYTKSEISSLTMARYWHSETGTDEESLDYEVVPSLLRPDSTDA